MTRVLISDPEGAFAGALIPVLEARGIETVGLPDDAASEVPEGLSAAILCDLVPALSVQPDAAGIKAQIPPEDRLARIEALIASAGAAGVPRLVLIAASKAPGAVLPDVQAASQRLETALAGLGTKRGVVLRAADVMDPVAPGMQKAVRALIRGGHAFWPAQETLEAIGLGDLAAAAAAAAERDGVSGRAFDIVTPEAVPRLHVAQEAERLAQILSNVHLTGSGTRPAYPAAEDRTREGAAAVSALRLAQPRSLWALLADCVQQLAWQASASGNRQPLDDPIPAVYAALETGALPLAGKQVVLTGATDEVGRAAAELLVRLGAEVTGVGEDAAAGAALVQEIEASQERFARLRAHHRAAAELSGRRLEPAADAAGNLRFEQANLADLASVRDLVGRLSARLPRIDGLIHAAAAAPAKRNLTPQGIETTLAVNLVAPVTLTRLLASPLTAAGKAGGARIVNRVGDAHGRAQFELEELENPRAFVPAEVQERLSTAMVMMTVALSSGMSGTGVSVLAVGPGAAEDPPAKPEEEAKPGGGWSPMQPHSDQDLADRPADAPHLVAAGLVEALVSSRYAPLNGGCLSGGEIIAPARQARDPARARPIWMRVAELGGLKP